MSNEMDRVLDEKKLKACPACGHAVEYKGLGEYYCSACDKIVYDDYGKVRHFVEEYPGATLVQIAQATGVDKAKLRRMVDEGKFVIGSGRSLM